MLRRHLALAVAAVVVPIGAAPPGPVLSRTHAAPASLALPVVDMEATVEAAQAWWSTDPYVSGGVWRDVTWHATRFAPLPYRGLPSAA